MTLQKIGHDNNSTKAPRQPKARRGRAFKKNKNSNSNSIVVDEIYQPDMFSCIHIPSELWKPERLTDLLDYTQNQTGYASEELALSCIQFSALNKNLYAHSNIKEYK